MTSTARILLPPGAAEYDDGWAAFQPQVRTAMEQALASSAARAGIRSPNFALLWDRLAGAATGGKWMRPRLVHFAYRAFGGKHPSACAELGAAFQLLHGALVVHDDVIDRDFVRRGRPTVGAGYRDDAASAGLPAPDAEHAGQSAAIIAGDLLLAEAMRLAMRAGTRGPDPEAVVDAVHGAILAAAAGELDDLVYSLDPRAADLDGVLEMEGLKTASYSFEAPLQAGAVLAAGPSPRADGLAAVGRRIGTAYQVVDDVLGTFGDPAVTGKSTESDLREGKCTVLVALASRDRGFHTAAEAFRAGAAGVEELRAALHAAGAERQAMGLAEGMLSTALREARNLHLGPDLLTELENICHHVLNRKK